MKSSDVHTLVRSRRAIRRYTDRPVSRTLISQIIDSATWAPSAHNRQPWRFAVLDTSSSLEKLALAMGARLRADRTADGDLAEAIERDVARSYARITGAAAGIVVCLSMDDMDVYPDAWRNEAERTMTVQSVAMAAQNLWLLAHAEGLGACWLCAPLFVPELVRDVVGLPAGWHPQGLITLGWPAQEKEKTRAPWESRVLFVDGR